MKNLTTRKPTYVPINEILSALGDKLIVEVGWGGFFCD
jgi:hypothetical protein